MTPELRFLDLYLNEIVAGALWACALWWNLDKRYSRTSQCY